MIAFDREAILQNPTRLAALQRYGLLSTSDDPILASLLRLAAQALHIPAMVAGFADADRLIVKSAVGMDVSSTSEPTRAALQALVQHVVVTHARYAATRIQQQASPPAVL